MRSASCSPSAVALLQSIAGVARAVESLYGPSLARKLLQDGDDDAEDLFTSDTHAVVRALHSENAAGAILLQAQDNQKREFGAGMATVVNLSGSLATAVAYLTRQGYSLASIQAALVQAEEICVQTLGQMRLPLDVALPDFCRLSRKAKLNALAALMLTDDSLDSAASVAVAVLEKLSGTLNVNSFMTDRVTTHCVHGSCSIQSSTRVLPGILAPIETEDRDRITFNLKTVAAKVLTGVVALNCDLPWSPSVEAVLEGTNSPWDQVHVVFVSGTVASQVLDLCSSMEKPLICIPVASPKSLEKLALISGAIIAESWREVLPVSVGHDPISISRIDIPVASNSRWHKEDELSTTLLCIDREPIATKEELDSFVSILIQAPTQSQGVERQSEVDRAIRTLSSTLQSSRGLLPSAGSYLCAIASAMDRESSSTGTQDGNPASDCLQRIAESFRGLCVLLLENYVALESNNESPADATSFLSRLAVVRKVERQFAVDIDGVGADKFFGSYNFKSTDYCALRTFGKSSLLPWRADDAAATVAAVSRSFRVVRLLCSVGEYEINSVSKHEAL